MVAAEVQDVKQKRLAAAIRHLEKIPGVLCLVVRSRVFDSSIGSEVIAWKLTSLDSSN